jgi:thiamine pyrophosphate-dependent acetolactate synthase large subunit-like protein
LAGIRAVRASYEEGLDAMARDTSDAIPHPAALASAIAAALPVDALAVFDGGHTTFWSNDFTPVQAARTRFHEPGMSHLGFGLPYALSLQLQHPGRPVFDITGDGSFGFTLNELDTARRAGLPVVNIIHNNAAWGIIRQGQKAQLGFEFATSLEGTDYAAIARGFGCFGETLTRADEVAPALARALASGLPSVLDCRTRFVPHPAAPAFGSMNRFGFEAFMAPAAAS